MNPNKEEAEEEELVWVDGYDSDATLPSEGDYAFATEAEKKAQSLLLRAPGDDADAPIESDEEEEAMMEVEEEEEAPAAAVSVRFCLDWQPKKTWAGTVPARKTKANKKKSQKALLPKKLRVALPVSVLDKDKEATLAHGVLVKGMAGGKREERNALLKRRASWGSRPGVWARRSGTRSTRTSPWASRCSALAAAPTTTWTSWARARAWRATRRRSWPRWTACARRRTRRWRRRTACWCSGPSACRLACSAARSSTRTSTREPRSSTENRRRHDALHCAPPREERAVIIGTEKKRQKRSLSASI
jgi:hypothetical protein